MWEALGEGELVKGSVGWENSISPKGHFKLQKQKPSESTEKGELVGLSGEGPAPARTQRVHPGVKVGDAGRKSGLLGTAWGREEIGS